MEHNNGRQGDMADQASGNNEVHIALKLKQTDAKILQAIDEALVRIDKGAYGVCRDCGEPIAEARLNAIPWTRVCISLQGEAEGVTPTDLAPLLREFYAERLALLQRHVVSARGIGDYDVNNAYQNVVAREETHVYWVHRAHPRRRRHRPGRCRRCRRGAVRRLAAIWRRPTLPPIRRSSPSGRPRWPRSRTPAIARCCRSSSARCRSTSGCSSRPPRAAPTSSACRWPATVRTGAVLGTRWVE